MSFKLLIIKQVIFRRNFTDLLNSVTLVSNFFGGFGKVQQYTVFSAYDDLEHRERANASEMFASKVARRFTEKFRQH